MNQSDKRTLIDSIKMKDYESIMRRVLDTPQVDKVVEKEEKATIPE